jgi:hypothetical protein
MSTAPNAIAGASSNVDGGSSAVETLDPVESLPTEGVDSPDTNTPEPEGGVDNQPEAGTGEPQGEVREDGRLIPQWMRAMKESNPEGYKAAKAVFFGMKERESIHPTVQAARDEHELVQSLGGREGASKLQEDSVFFKDAANQFLKGDPAFTKDLWEEDPIAAALHVSPMLEEFKTRDLDGYKSTIARIWENDFKRLNFAPALQDLSSAIQRGDKATAAEIAKSIQEWHDSILDVSKRAEDPRVKTLLAERNKAHETRQQTERQEFIKTYQTETINEVVSEAGKVFDSFFKGRKIDADDRTDLLREALSLANKAVEADETFMKQQNTHLNRGDSHSAKRMTKARYSQEITNAVKRIARRYGLVSGNAKPAPATQQNPNNNGQGARPAQGYAFVNARPSIDEIDQQATARANGGSYQGSIVAKRAVLRDGRKVDWSKVK